MSDFDERARRAAEGAKRAIEDADLKIDDGERTAKRRVTRRTAAISSVAAFALVAGVVSILPSGNGSDTVSLNGKDGAFQLAGALQPFDACDDALDYFKKNAADFYLKQYDQRLYAATDDMAAGAPATTIPSDGNATGAPQRDATTSSAESLSNSGSHSTTNVAEKNVDEPDIVKTDGNRIVTVTNGKARLLSANSGSPVIRSTLSDMQVKNVFLVDDRLVVFRTTQPDYYTMEYPSSRSVNNASTAVIYDIADIANPKSLGSIEVTGSVIDARMVGTQVRLVTSYTPDVEVSPSFSPNGVLTDESIKELNETIASSKLESWTPSFTLRDAKGAEVDKGQLVECSDLGHPQVFSGIGTTSLITFDANGSLTDHHSAGVVAGGQQVYATANTLYVTSTSWTGDTRASTTDIHAFATDNAGVVKYEGSGSVGGTLLNQYSMSEFEGALRIATTLSESRGWINRRSVTQGQVAVLKLQGGKLEQIGLVTGLGAKDNESIQSVRFVGARGYVTTYRQTDPFYVLDLKDPKAPKITGELKIPGFSSYLHPIGENVILGVGQSGLMFEGRAVPDTAIPQTTIVQNGGGSSSGVTAPDIAPSVNGVEFSLFDVSNPADPKKVSSKLYGSGNAGAQFDSKAFLYYEPMNLIVSPLTEYNYSARELASGDKSTGMWSGLVLLRPTDNGLVEVGRLQNSDAQSFSVERTFIIDNNVYQLSMGALQVNDLDTHKQVARVAL